MNWMTTIVLIVIGLILYFKLIIAGLRKGLALDAQTREVQRNKRREVVSFDALPPAMKKVVEQVESELSGYKRLCFYNNDFFAVGYRGSHSAVFVSDDAERVAAVSYLRMPRTIFIPLGLGGYPITLPFWKHTAEIICGLSCGTYFADGSHAAVMTIKSPGDWWPPDITIESIEVDSTPAALLAAFEKVVRRHLTKRSSIPKKVQSVAEYFELEAELQSKLSNFSEQKMKSIMEEAGLSGVDKPPVSAPSPTPSPAPTGAPTEDGPDPG